MFSVASGCREAATFFFLPGDKVHVLIGFMLRMEQKKRNKIDVDGVSPSTGTTCVPDERFTISAIKE